MTATAFKTAYDADPTPDTELLGNLDPKFFTVKSGFDILDDLADGHLNVVLHAMNRKSNFRHGFSRQVAQRFPEAQAADLENDVARKGEFSYTYEYDEYGNLRMIINLYCIRNKPKNGSLLSLKQLDQALISTWHFLNDLNRPLKVGMVKMGTGIAGGDWGEISHEINGSFGTVENSNLECYLYV